MSALDIFMREINASLNGEDCETIVLSTVNLECGICGHEWELALVTGDRKLPSCPECGNATLQMILGK